MSYTTAALRSVLYVPAANPRALAKVVEGGAADNADAVIFDLEDSAAIDQKIEARARLRSLNWQALKTRQGPRFGIRVNGQGTEFQAGDLAMAADVEPDFIVLPKVENQASLVEVRKAVSTPIWAMIETPIALMQLNEIASSDLGLEALLLGLEDLAKDMGITALPDRSNLGLAMQQVAIAAKAYGLVALDGVYKDLSDDQGFIGQCQNARVLGYEGKSLIHPKTIDACNLAFSPSEQELANAQAIIEAFEAARAAGAGVATLDGQMIEALHVEQAKKLIGQSITRSA